MAWRNVWRNKVRSLVITSSVSIGLFAGVAITALYNGMMNNRMRTVIDSETGHLQIHHPEFKKDYDPKFLLNGRNEWYGKISSVIPLKAITVRSVTTGMLATPAGSAGVQVNGIVNESEMPVSQLNKKIREGKYFNAKRKNEILISRKLADKMKLSISSKLVLTFTDTASDIVSAAFRVCGIYQTNNTPADERNVYVSINDLNELLGMGQAFHEIVMLLKKDDELAAAQQTLQTIFPQAFIESWKEISPETELMVNTLDLYMYIIIGIIMLALAFGIINTMLMGILERTREIGMMVALGMNRFRLSLLILLETVFLTLAGSPMGLFVAWLASSYYHKKGIDISSFAGKTMSSFGFSSIVYPAFPVEQLPVIMMMVITTAFVSCIFPAIKSAGLQAAEALRK